MRPPRARVYMHARVPRSLSLFLIEFLIRGARGTLLQGTHRRPDGMNDGGMYRGRDDRLNFD